MVLSLSLFGPAVIGLLIALARHLRRRSAVALLPRGRRMAAIGMGLALACLIATSLWSLPPAGLPALDQDGTPAFELARFGLPLLLCVGALFFLVGRAHTSPAGPTELAPRTLLSFASRPGLVALAAIAVSVVIVALVAGAASSPDEAGRYVRFALDGAGGGYVGLPIYGWWFSLPCLALVAIIIAIVLIELTMISRPPLTVDRDVDVADRRGRVRNVLAVSTGGLLLHLAVVLRSLYDTSAVMLYFDAGAAGTVEFRTSFAAFGPALVTASYVVAVLGFMLWWSVLLSTLPARTSQPQTPVPA